MKKFVLVVVLCLIAVAIVVTAFLLLPAFKHTHEFGEWETVSPTCTEPGKRTRTCLCEYSEIESIPALGHDMVSEAKKDPTCTSKGWNEYEKCSRCPHSTYEEVASTGHKYEISVIAPTCTEKGYTVHTCACGESYTDTYIAETGHSFGNWETVKASTCIALGSEKRSCGNCIYDETRDIALSNHTPGEWIIDTEPTHTTDGSKHRICSVCDTTIELSHIPMLKHTHEATVTAPTCTEMGYTTYVCTGCGDIYTSDITYALGHTYSDWSVTSAPTCDAGGLQVRSCTVCQTSETQELAKYTHKYESEATETDDIIYCCLYCRDILEIQDNIVPEASTDYELISFCENNFSFTVVSANGEAYIYENLLILDMQYADSLASLASMKPAGNGGLYEGQVTYTVTPVTDQPNTYTVSVAGGYAPYNTYAAQLYGELSFADYNTETLVFNVQGEDKQNVKFNEDNIIFLRALENRTSGYYPYTLVWDENAERYYVTLSKGDAFGEGSVGKVLCLGEYTCGEQILLDKSPEVYFGKIESVSKAADGHTFIVLGAPALGDIYDALEFSGEGVVNADEIMKSADTIEQVKTAFMMSDGFAEMVATAQMVASAYASDCGYEAVARKGENKGVKLTITPEQTYESIIGDGTEYKYGWKITCTVTVDLKKSGKTIGYVEVYGSGSLDISLKTKFSETSEKDKNDLISDFNNFNFSIINENTVKFKFGCKIVMEYSAETPELVVNSKTGKIHDPDCRYYTKSQNESQFIKYSINEFLRDYGVDSIDKKADQECKVCRAVTKLCRRYFAVTESTGTVHCVNCVHVSEKSVFFRDLPKATDGYTYCKDCKPQNISLEDVEYYMSQCFRSEDWPTVLNGIKETMNTALGKSESSTKKDLVTVPFTFAVIQVDIKFGIKFDFNLSASMEYTVEKTWKNYIDIARVGDKYECKINDGVDKKDLGGISQTLEARGSITFEVAGVLEVTVGFTGVSKFCHIGFTAELGLYAELYGILSFADQYDKKNDVFYCAARFEAGIYSEANFVMKLFWWDKEILLARVELPILQGGYDRAYYRYKEYDKELDVNSYSVSIDSMDILNVEYMKIDGLKNGSEKLKAAGSDQYTVSYSFSNDDGSDNPYCFVLDGELIIDPSAPHVFDVIMTVTVEGKKKNPVNFGDFSALLTSSKKAKLPYIFFLDPYTVTLHVKLEDSGVIYELNKDQKSYSVVGTDYLHTEVVISPTYNGKPVTAIVSGAFSENYSIGMLYIPYTVTYIAHDAFSFGGGSYLTSIIVDPFNPNYLAYDNYLIETSTNTLILGCNRPIVEIPYGVEYIGPYAFYHRTDIEVVIMPQDLIGIGDSAFAHCGNLQSVYIPENVEKIGDGAFTACGAITSITIPDRVTYIGAGAFDSCHNLANLSIGQNVTYIGDRAFSYCESLWTIWIPENVTYIGDRAFSYCKSLWAIWIPKNVNSIGHGAFDDCRGLLNIIVDEDNKTYYSAGNCLIERSKQTLIRGCQSSVIPNGVVSIAPGAFSGCYGLQSISIPESVISIEAYAFDGCSSVRSIDILGDVTSIGDGAFRDCRSLLSIVIPDGVTKLSYEIFEYCSSLKNVILPESIKEIEDYAFYRCESLANITYNGTKAQWEKIEKGNYWDSQSGRYTVYCTDGVALKPSTGLTYATVNGELMVYKIGSCKDIDIVIPSTYKDRPVVGIYTSAFADCTNIKSVTIPNSVTIIRGRAFSGCTGLTSVTIPASVTSIDYRAFENCSSLKSITIPASVKSIGIAAFYNCTRLESIVIPSGVKTVEDELFYNCTSLDTVTIPASVTSIGDSAFYKCTSLENITLPTSVTSIGERAFEMCKKLVKIMFSGTKVQWNKISKGSYWDSGTGKYTVYCLGGDGETEEPDSDNLEYTLNADGKSYSVTGIGSCADTNLVIPSTYKGKPVTKIGNMAFTGQYGLISVVIPGSVTTIEYGAFSSCLNLKTVTILSGVKTIGESAFMWCDKLEKVTIPDTVTSIGDYAFEACPKFTHIIFGGITDKWVDIKKGKDWKSDEVMISVDCTDGGMCV